MLYAANRAAAKIVIMRRFYGWPCSRTYSLDSSMMSDELTLRLMKDIGWRWPADQPSDRRFQQCSRWVG
jgi:hypothetical protein